jgi:septal ring factor EnvC (AmiA/AmiB activator)
MRWRLLYFVSHQLFGSNAITQEDNMPRIRSVINNSLVALFVVGLLSTGCTKYASEDDLANLEEAKQAAMAAEKMVQDKESEKADLQRELAKLNEELATAESELELVKN